MTARHAQQTGTFQQRAETSGSRSDHSLVPTFNFRLSTSNLLTNFALRTSSSRWASSRRTAASSATAHRRPGRTSPSRCSRISPAIEVEPLCEGVAPLRPPGRADEDRRRHHHAGLFVHQRIAAGSDELDVDRLEPGCAIRGRRRTTTRHVPRALRTEREAGAGGAALIPRPAIVWPFSKRGQPGLAWMIVPSCVADAVEVAVGGRRSSARAARGPRAPAASRAVHSPPGCPG